MNIIELLEKAGKLPVANADKAQTRREAFTNFSDWGKTFAMIAAPTALLGLIPESTKAKVLTPASTSDAIVDILNFALTLEYLESSFYNQGLTSGVILSADRTVFTQIAQHENSHVATLTATIQQLNGTPATKPTFDFTAGGMFNPFTVYADFLALSQAFEDTGVRAYKGQAGGLISNNAVLTAALQIHSVEARHACEVRRLRNKNNLDATAKGWISGASRGTLPAATQPTYNGEDNLTQGTVTDVSASNITTVGAAAMQEAFDEPLTMAQVLAIAGNFIQ